MITRSLILLALLTALLAGGCARAKGTGEFHVNAGQYAAAFDAARNSLIGRRFPLERVDARAGVITTQAKSTSGLATPWDGEQSTPEQEIEDLFNGQQRRIRITFETIGDESTPPEDFRTVTGPLSARVEVVIERIHRPGMKIEPTSVRFSTPAQDPALIPRGMYPSYAVPFSQDPYLAARIAREIEERTKAATSAN